HDEPCRRTSAPRLDRSKGRARTAAAPKLLHSRQIRRQRKTQASMATVPPIVVVKKKPGHSQAHGGAWKVAYADFVTAMMALFIVLWLMNSSKQVQEAVGGYFKDPTGTSKMVGSDQSGSGENFTLSKDDMPKLREELQKVTRQMPNFEALKSQIQ